VIETEEKEMIHRLFEFGDTVVRRVMTPRSDITAVEADVDVDTLIRVVTESGHSRLPVYDDELDNVIGIIHVKDVLKAVTSGQKNLSIRSMLREPYVVPESKRVDDLLSEFRRTHTQIAIVRDADGGTVSGLVTLEDLLEEIVGDIQDEYDQEEAPLWKQLDPNTCLVDGRVEIEDFNDRFGVDLPTEEGVDTVGGFVFNLMGHQPAHGEKAVWHTIEFKVEETDGKRIQRVCVAKQTSGRDETHAEAPEAESTVRNGNGSAPTEVNLPSRDTVNH
jgi:putative hemolysin